MMKALNLVSAFSRFFEQGVRAEYVCLQKNLALLNGSIHVRFGRKMDNRFNVFHGFMNGALIADRSMDERMMF